MEKRKQEDECKTGVLVNAGDYSYVENVDFISMQKQLVTEHCTDAPIAKCKTPEEEITVSQETK